MCGLGITEVFTSMTRDEIFNLLEKNQISMRPDDGAALEIIERYVNAEDSGTCAEVSEELAKLDESIDKAADAAESVYRGASEAAMHAVGTIRYMLDGWGTRSILRDFAFSFSYDERRYIANTFSDTCAVLQADMTEMSSVYGRAGEAAAMLRSCAADASSLASELKYAALAARLKGDDSLEADRQALSDETRERAEAAEKLAAEIMGVIRSLSTAMASISAAVPAAAAALHFDDDGEDISDLSKLISPKRAAAVLSDAVSADTAAGFDFG